MERYAERGKGAGFGGVLGTPIPRISHLMHASMTPYGKREVSPTAIRPGIYLVPLGVLGSGGLMDIGCGFGFGGPYQEWYCKLPSARSCERGEGW